MSTPIDDEPTGAADGSTPAEVVSRVTGPSYGTSVTEPGARENGARESGGGSRSPGMLITVLASVVSLLAGVVIGLLIPRGAEAPTAAPTGTAVTAQQQAPASPSPSAAPEPTLTEEQRQAQVDLLRQQPRRVDGDPYAVGAVDAPVVMIEYADYQCGYCQQFAMEVKPALQYLVDEGTLRIEWRDFPIFGGDSTTLAIAARAAGQQGLFWEYNLAAMTDRNTNKTPLTQDTLIALATEVGVPDIDAFTAALADPALAAEVQAEYDSALALLGQPSTPQFIINDVYIGGSGPAEAFIGVIEDELAKVQ